LLKGKCYTTKMADDLDSLNWQGENVSPELMRRVHINTLFERASTYSTSGELYGAWKIMLDAALRAKAEDCSIKTVEEIQKYAIKVVVPAIKRFYDSRRGKPLERQTASDYAYTVTGKYEIMVRRLKSEG